MPILRSLGARTLVGRALSLIDGIQRWVAEPAPDRYFEITETSLSLVSSESTGQPVVEMLDERGLTASPASPNLIKPQLYRDALTKISGSGKGNQTRTALVIPDYAVRMSIIDFEDFPATEEERSALLRFRLRKSVPFHIEEARLSYSVQLQENGRIEVLVVAIADPILKEYESLFTGEGFRVGLVTPSSVAALPLCEKSDQGLTLLVKRAGWTLSVLLLQQARVRLVRCLDLSDSEMRSSEPDRETVLSLVQQTLAYAEDQIGMQVMRLLLCGFGIQTDSLGRDVQEEFGMTYSVLMSRFGAVPQEIAGLLGLMEQSAA